MQALNEWNMLPYSSLDFVVRGSGDTAVCQDNPDIQSKTRRRTCFHGI